MMAMNGNDSNANGTQLFYLDPGAPPSPPSGGPSSPTEPPLIVWGGKPPYTVPIMAKIPKMTKNFILNCVLALIGYFNSSLSNIYYDCGYALHVLLYKK